MILRFLLLVGSLRSVLTKIGTKCFFELHIAFVFQNDFAFFTFSRGFEKVLTVKLTKLEQNVFLSCIAVGFK